jgi:2'-5' RNA ligase
VVPTLRLFIAITLPPEIKSQLASYAGSIAALAARARPTRQENFHLTLAFLGGALTDVEACAALAAVSGAPFKLYSDKPGVFRRAGGDLHWLGLKSSAELTALYAGLVSALASVGFAVEKRNYSPHITLAREVRGLSGGLPLPPRFVVPVLGLTLMNSEQINGVLTYTPLYVKAFNSADR